jgi:pullulanase
VQTASFSNGNFVVPALTTAVFVKPQGEVQGFGLSALPAYGTNTIYLRGAMNNWDTSLPFTYIGNDKYRLAADLLQGEYQFKVADGSFSTANIGGGFNMPIAQAANLTNGGDNLTLNLIADGQYVFELDASDGQSPSLLITPDDPLAIPAPYGDTVIYLRGLMNEWGTTRPLTYQGNGIYSGNYQITDGQHSLKIADADWGGTGGPNLGGTHNIALGASVELTPNSNDNLSLNLASTQTLAFVLDANDVSKPTLTISEIIE